MTDAGFFRGTSADQDNRFANKQKKLLKELNFSPILNTKLNMSKIDIDTLKPWIETKIKEVLEKDDELLSESIYEHLAEKEPDGKSILVLITGFVDEIKASKFMEELWTKLVDLQNNSNGKAAATEESSTLEHKSKDSGTPANDNNSPTHKKDHHSDEPRNSPEDSEQKDTARPDRGSRSRSRSRSHSATPPSRSVSKSPGGHHRLDELSRGRPRRRAHEDDNSSRDGSHKGSLTPSSTSRSPNGPRHNKGPADASPRGLNEKPRQSSRTRSHSKSPSRRRFISRSRSSSRSRSRSPWNRSRSPHSRPFRGRRSPMRRSPARRSPIRRRSRSRSRSRSYRPRSRSPRGRRGFGGPRGSYRGPYGGFPDRRRGGFGGAGVGMRRRSPLGNNRRFSPRSPPRYRRSPSFSPRRRRRSPSPYHRRISRSRSPPPHMIGRNISPPRGHHPAEMLGPRHPSYHDLHRPMLPNPRMNPDHRPFVDGPMLPRHSPAPILSKIPDMPSTSQGGLSLQPEPSSQETHSPPSSGRKKHKKDKKHRKHKKSKKHRSVTPDRKKKKHKKSKKHKDH